MENILSSDLGEEKGLREVMRKEFQDKIIFKDARRYAFNYVDHIEDRPVFPLDNDLNNLEIFDEDFPENHTPSLDILSNLDKYGTPNTIAQIGGRYFGMVNGGVIPVTVAVKWLTDMWDQNGGLYNTSPINAKLESVVEKWLIHIFGLSTHSVAGFVSGSSMAILCGLLAARHRIYTNLDWDVNQKGLCGAPQIRIVTSAHIHSAVLKAIAMAGLGKENIEFVPVDDQGRVLVESIPELDKSTILILQAGNVHSGSFDHFESIFENKVKNSGAWVHIDGAFGLWAAASESLKYLTKGMENAHSFSVDGHKTLNTPYDSGIVLCSDREALYRALQCTGSYIAYTEHRDGMLYTPEMSKRSRAIEMWAALKFLGRQGVDELVTTMHKRALLFAKSLSENSGFKILNDVVFNQVLVACKDDQMTERVLKNIQDQRVCWVGGSSWFGKKVIRISVCSWVTSEFDVFQSVESFNLALRSNSK